MPPEEEFNVGSIVDSFVSSLGEGGGETSGEASSLSSSAGESTLPPTTPETPPAYVPREMPKSWKKEMEPVWKSASKELHDYVYEREGNVSRGIQSYKDGYERWNKLVTPFAKQLEAAGPDFDAVGLMTNLLQTHIALTNGEPGARKTMAQQLLSAYGIDLADQPAPQVPNELLQRVSSIESALEQEKKRAALGVVEKFFSDPKNEFAKDLQDDILQYVQRGYSLEDSYERAMWTNPTVRAKVIAKQQGSSKPAPLNLEGNPSNNAPAPRKGTMDDTIASIVSKHMTQH